MPDLVVGFRLLNALAFGKPDPNDAEDLNMECEDKIRRQSSTWRIVLLLAALWGCPANLEAQPGNNLTSEGKTVRLLTVGNSFSANATHYLPDLAKSRRNTLIHQSLVVAGAPLDLHWGKVEAFEKNPKDPTGLYGDRSLKQYLLSEPWDYVTIQQASIKSHDVGTYRPFAKKLRDFIKKHRPKAEVLIHQTWAYRVDDPRFSATPPQSGEPATQAEMHRMLTKAYVTIAEELSLRRIPVGDAFHLADTDSNWGYRPDKSFDFKKKAPTTVPDQPHSLHVGWHLTKGNDGRQKVELDCHHANMAGEYLGACVWYEILFGESAVENKFVPNGLNPEYAGFLQETAHKAIAASRTEPAIVETHATMPQTSNGLPTVESALVSEFPCPDPYVLHDGSDWYIFGTGAQPFFLQGKEFGIGKMKIVPLQIDYKAFPMKVAQIWGFVVYRHTDGSYHAYGTLHLGDFHTVIGYFEPQPGEHWEPGLPITRWRFKNFLVGDPFRKDWKYYESKILVDKNKSNYLMYVANVGKDNVIMAQKMKSLGEVDRNVPARVLLRPDGYRSEDRNDPQGMQLVEGGSIFKWKDKYVLLYSVGDFLLNNYKLGMAFSDTLIPPSQQTYKKVKLADPNEVWGSNIRPDEIGYLLQSRKSDWPNYSRQLVLGPGLGSIVSIDDSLWLFFHGYKPDDNQRRPENRFVFRLPVTIELDRGEPSLKWVHTAFLNHSDLEKFDRKHVKRPMQPLKSAIKSGVTWEGISDWGSGKTTKSELRCIKTAGLSSEWEFTFLEGTIFKTPVPFREKWVGEIINDTTEGAYLKLTRHDGKAHHKYTLDDEGDLTGIGVNTTFRFRFQVK